jgi:hypothetical protein
MGKRPANEEPEMDTVKEHLNRQDKTLNEILIVMKGSVALGVDGVVYKLKEMEKSQQQIISDIAHLQRWKKSVQESKGKFTVSWVDVAKTIFSIIGVSGTIVGLFLAIKQLFDQA